MSIAHKCDRCWKLYELEPGCIALDVNLETNGGSCDSWSEVEFCPACSVAVRDVIGKAIEPPIKAAS